MPQIPIINAPPNAPTLQIPRTSPGTFGAGGFQAMGDIGQIWTETEAKLQGAADEVTYSGIVSGLHDQADQMIRTPDPTKTPEEYHQQVIKDLTQSATQSLDAIKSPMARQRAQANLTQRIEAYGIEARTHANVQLSARTIDTTNDLNVKDMSAYAEETPENRPGIAHSVDDRIQSLVDAQIWDAEQAGTVRREWQRNAERNAVLHDAELHPQQTLYYLSAPIPLRKEKTVLSSSEESAFQKWYKENEVPRGMNPNPDDPLHYYDIRGAWKEGMTRGPGAEGHWDDKYKMEGSPEAPQNNYIHLTEIDRRILRSEVHAMAHAKDESVEKEKKDFGDQIKSAVSDNIERNVYGTGETTDRLKAITEAQDVWEKQYGTRILPSEVMDHIESHLTAHATRTTKTDNKESKALASTYEYRAIGTTADVRKQLLANIDADFTAGSLTPEDAKAAKAAVTNDETRSEAHAEHVAKMQEAAGKNEDAAKTRAKARVRKEALLDADVWLPSLKGLQGKLNAEAVTAGKTQVKQIIDDALDRDQDAGKAVEEMRPIILQKIYGTAKAARQARESEVLPYGGVPGILRSSLPRAEKLRLLGLAREREELKALEAQESDTSKVTHGKP